MIILVRHGEATHHTEHFTGGWTDSDLTDKGRLQIEAAAEKLARDFVPARMPHFRILCSDLKRAHESAVIFAEKLGLAKVEDYSFLREKNNGRAAGLKESEICRNIAEILAEKMKINGYQFKVYQQNDCLYEVSKESNNYGADIFISIHCNASTDLAANGTETLYYKNSVKIKN